MIMAMNPFIGTSSLFGSGWNRRRWVPASDETDLSRKPKVCEEQKN